MMRVLKMLATVVALMVQAGWAMASESALDDLKNYQVNNNTMMSSGLPDESHFKALKAKGVSRVVDLIPGDRSEEAQLVDELGLGYHNIQVVWENPTLENFQDYVAYMQSSSSDDGITLTHCKLNWRGSAFTYLYRVTQLGEPEEQAKADMLAIWQPDETWQAFIDTVKNYYDEN